MGSSLSAREANAPSRITAAGVTPSTANGAPSVSEFWVRVPVLSAHSTSTPASSSMATSRLTMACFLASSRAPTAIVTDSTVGIATGIAATVSTRANCSVVRTGSPRRIAVTTITRDQRDREEDQVVADLEHGALEMADGVRVLDQFGGLAEVGVSAGGVDQGADLTLPDDGSGEHGVAGLAGGGQRLPGQRGLVDLDLVAVQQPGVGGDDVTQAQPDHVTGHQLPRRCGDPCAVAHHARVDRQLGFQGLNRVAGLAFLGVADHAVGHQQQQDDKEIRPVPHRARQDDGDLDHPRDRTPEVAEELQQRVGLVFGDLIGPVLGQPLAASAVLSPSGRVAQLRLHLGHRRRLEVADPARHCPHRRSEGVACGVSVVTVSGPGAGRQRQVRGIGELAGHA